MTFERPLNWKKKVDDPFYNSVADKSLQITFLGKEMTARSGEERKQGKLYWIGENPAVDPVITREVEGKIQVLLITRPKDGKLAFPGGFINQEIFQEGEKAEVLTANAELDEETLLVDKNGNKITFSASDKTHEGKLLTEDPRNDDVSKITTAIFHKHFTGEDAFKLGFRQKTEEEKGNKEYSETVVPPAWYNIVVENGVIMLEDDKTGEKIKLEELNAGHGKLLANLIKQKNLL